MRAQAKEKVDSATKLILQAKSTKMELDGEEESKQSSMISEQDHDKLESESVSTIEKAKLICKLAKDSPGLNQLVKELKKLIRDLNCVFEWHDGILVESMQQGGLLLIDEISLANDSVLERLNSIFEPERTLILSEKSSEIAVKIQAAPAFSIVATMNPSGDFGKKELSPAMRNRMTEIWVDSYFSQPELVNLCMERLNSQMFTNASELNKVDLFMMINQKVKSTELAQKDAEKISLCVLNVVMQTNFYLGYEYFAMTRRAVSLRDILNLVDFMQMAVLQLNLPIAQAFRHSVELVIIDGLCLGLDVP